MTLKEINKYEDFIINIGKFLSRYYYINIDKVNSLSHEAFMEIFQIEGMAPKDVSLEDVIRGDMILVTDAYDRVFGYKNPLIITNNDEEEYFINNIKIEFEENEPIDIGNIKLENLSDYELDKLLDESKKVKDERAKNKIIKELKFRPESKPGVKKTLIEKVRKREFIKIKERNE